MIDSYLTAAREAAWPIPKPKGRLAFACDPDGTAPDDGQCGADEIHTMLVIGNHDLEASAVSVREHGEGNLGARPKVEVVAYLSTAIKERRG